MESPSRFARLDTLVEHYVASGPILDVGCGDGRMVARLRAAGHDCIGLDRSERALSRARHLHGGGGWVLGDGQALPFAEASFGAVISLYFTANLMDRDRFVTEAARVLRPGGRLAFTLVNPRVRALDAAQARIRRGRAPDVAGLIAYVQRLGRPIDEWRRLHRHGLAPELLVGPLWMPVLRRRSKWLRNAPVLRGPAVAAASDILVRAQRPIGRSDAVLTGTERSIARRLARESVAGFSPVMNDIGPGRYLLATPFGLARASWLARVSLWPSDAHWFQPDSGPRCVVWPDAVVARVS